MRDESGLLRNRFTRIYRGFWTQNRPNHLKTIGPLTYLGPEIMFVFFLPVGHEHACVKPFDANSVKIPRMFSCNRLK